MPTTNDRGAEGRTHNCRARCEEFEKDEQRTRSGSVELTARTHRGSPHMMYQPNSPSDWKNAEQETTQTSWHSICGRRWSKR